MIILVAIILVCYLFILLKYDRGYTRLVAFHKSIEATNYTFKTSFTIIVPYRNEAKNIPSLLDSFSQLNYPTSLFDIIMVNDESDDFSYITVNDYPLANLQNIHNKRSSASPKKDAITTAISLATKTWVITTDADCIVPKNWLLELDQLIQKVPAKMICGPVLYTSTKSLLQDFQQLDGISLQGCTMGSFGHQKPLLSNGANLAYPKELFNQLQGFEGNNHLASGDDIFMLEKVKASFPKDIHFLFSKDAIVKTQPESTWKGLVRQRVRWASKTSQTKNKRSIGIGLLVFITNLVCVLLPILSFYIPSIWMLTILFWLAKISVDCIFMYQTNRFFKANISVIRMLQCGLLYPIITCWIVAQSIKGTYTWKGRSYRK